MLSGGNGRIEKAGSRFIRIKLSRQYTKTITKIRDQREEQGKIERNKRSGQRSAVLLATQQSNVQYTHNDMSLYTQGRQRRRLRQTRRDGTEQVDTVSVDDGEMTGDGVRTVRRRRRRCNGSSRRAYMEQRRATSTAKDDRMIARGGRHRMSEIKNVASADDQLSKQT